ncbi:MAG TPA: ABC transporter permease [Vicinamibacterales bacterium]|nr:ABC transporter permease [Vicinamibacterales bacterium]
MDAFADVWRRLRSLAGRRDLDDRLDDEIRFHVEQQTEKYRRAGIPPDEARRQALIRFGGVEQKRQETRDQFRAPRIENLARDVRYGLRSLWRHPAFSAMAVLSLAIGIGANAVIFGVVHALLYRPFPLAQPETLVNVYETEGGRGFNLMSHPNIEDLRRSTTQVFSGIAASTFFPAPVGSDGTAQIVMGELVNGGAFAVLGVEPLLGRAILPEDDVARGGHPVVMLNHAYWQRAFAADPQAVGRTLQIGGRGYTIIGVAPAGYRGGFPLLSPAFYVPMAMADELMGAAMLTERDAHSFFVKARLAPGVTRLQAEHTASLVADGLTRARPEGWVPGERFSLVPTADVQIYPGIDPLLRAAALLLVAVVGLVLLLACTNLASVLLARALDRGREVAVRRAIGATRVMIARQLLVESALLGLGGAAAGFVLAVVLLKVLVSIDLPLPYTLKLDSHFGIDSTVLFDWRVLALTAVAGALTGSALGLVPAVQGTRGDVGSALKTGSRGGDAPGSLRWRNALVIAQVAMSLVLLVGAGLFLRSWHKMLAVDPGFGRNPASVLTLMIPVARSTPDETVQRTHAVLERLRIVPGVEAAGLVWPLPLEFASSFTDFTIDGRVPPPDRAAFRADRVTVDDAFFDAAGIAIIAGRTFTEADRRDTQPVAVISQAMARRYWPDGDALGRVLRRPDPAERDLMVVGVASDVNVRSLGETPRDVVYESYTQGAAFPMFNFVVRVATDPSRISPVLVAAAREVDPDVKPVQSTTMAQHLAMSRLPSQMGAFMLSAFAAMAMVLATIGVYGLVRYTVAMRTREVGIRMALGADAAGVARLLATGGLRLALIGGAIGVVVSLVAASYLTKLLFGVGAFDPFALTGAPLVLGLVAWLAAYLPARRASRANPLAALRSE